MWPPPPGSTRASWLQPRPSFKLPNFILSRGRPYLLHSMHGVGGGSGQEGSRVKYLPWDKGWRGAWLRRPDNWDLGPEKSSFPFFFFHCSWMCILIRIIVSKYNRSFSSLKYNVTEPSLLRYKEPLTHIEGVWPQANTAQDSCPAQLLWVSLMLSLFLIHRVNAAPPTPHSGLLLSRPASSLPTGGDLTGGDLTGGDRQFPK